MANIKSAKKRIKTNEKRRQRNVSRKSEIKTLIKKYIAAIDEKNVNTAKDLLKITEAKIARAAGKKVIKKNTASNKISKLAVKLSNLKKAVNK